jgi:mono/diheme cytochrome c family protein
MITMITILSVAGAAFAFEPGNERKGKYLYRSNCRTCHMDGATAPALGPMDKTQAQWERVFETYERLECAAEWEKFSDSDRTDMLTYLYNHAFDSPSPATCE